MKADALKDIPTTSFENALNGKVAGLQLTNNSGQAGSAPAIRIRGIGSMNAGNEPLYVVDGVPVSSGNTGQMSGELYSTNNIMNTLNPEDIESISVLKDAAASSLYGSRAANGVILITTKKGQIGKPVVTLKAEVGFTPCWATDNYETASVQENVNMLYTVFHDARTSGKGETDEKAAAYAIGQLNSRFNKHGYQFTTMVRELTRTSISLSTTTPGVEANTTIGTRHISVPPFTRPTICPSAVLRRIPTITLPFPIPRTKDV